MKRLIKQLGPRETAVIISLLIIFSAGLILKYSGWKKPETFDYTGPDKQFEEKTKADFNLLKGQYLNDYQKERAEEIKKLADSLLNDDNNDESTPLNLNISVNINTGYAADLMKLPGIGEVTAERIIEYREKKEKFNKIEDLMNVKGIGKKKFGKLKQYITVE